MAEFPWFCYFGWYFMEHHGAFTAPFCFVSTFMGHSSEYNKDSPVGHRYKKVVGFPMFNHWMLLMSKRHLNLRHCQQCVHLVVRVSDHSDHPFICPKYKLLKKSFSDFKAGCDTKLCVNFEAGVQPEATPAILRTRHTILDHYPK